MSKFLVDLAMNLAIEGVSALLRSGDQNKNKSKEQNPLCAKPGCKTKRWGDDVFCIPHGAHFNGSGTGDQQRKEDKEQNLLCAKPGCKTKRWGDDEFCIPHGARHKGSD